jgi:hypothetical protein
MLIFRLSGLREAQRILDRIETRTKVASEMKRLSIYNGYNSSTTTS